MKSFDVFKTNKKILLIIFIFIAFLLLVSSFVSYVKFNTINPFATGYGLLRIMVFNVDYEEIQSNPRVIIAKPDYAWQLFLDTIEKEGYTYLKEERMGSLCSFKKNGKRERVFFSVNGYFSKWIWEKQ